MSEKSEEQKPNPPPCPEDCVDIEILVVMSENYTTTQRVRLPKSLDSLGVESKMLQEALLATVAPQVAEDVGFAFDARDLQAVRFTPAHAPGMPLSQFAKQQGKMHLLFMNPEHGSVSRLRMMADAVTGMTEELHKKDAEIEKLKQRIAELEIWKENFLGAIAMQQQLQQQQQQQPKEEK